MSDSLGSAVDLAARLPIGLVQIGADNRLIYANQAAERLLGIRLPVPALADKVVEALGPAGASLGRLLTGQRATLLLGNRQLEVECQSHAVGRLWMITDQSVIARLQAQQTENAGLLAFSHEAFLIIDTRGYIRYANQPCERERGFPTHAMVGMHIRELERWCTQSFEEPRQPDEDEVLVRIVQVVQTGGPLRYHAFHMRQDGSEIPVEATIRPYRLSNEQVILLVARDESRRLLHLQAVMQAKGEAEAANRAKSAFLAITSHELRTPLTGIIGFCELLGLEIFGGMDAADRTPPPGALTDTKAVGRYIKLIYESSQSLLSIINDVVDLSKIEARSLELRMGRVDPCATVSQAVRMWTARAGAKELSIEVQPPEGTPFLVNADAQRLRQMLDNLLSNAVKFSTRGAVTVRVRYGPDHADIAVRDTGQGIPHAAREYIFDAFWQASDHHTRENGGSGLGLYITRALAEMQGGRAWLEDTGDKGSEFRIRLPREGTQPSIRRKRIINSGAWSIPPRPPAPPTAG